MSEIKLYTLDEVGEMLRVSRRTLYNYIKTGKLKSFKMGKYRRVTEEDLNAFIESCIQAPTGD